MDDQLQDAAKRGDTEMLYTLLRENPKLFDSIADERFAVTPLHVAASSDHYESNGSPDEREDAASRMAEFALEMAILEPSFTRKLNTDGLTPMHLALLHEKWETVRALMTHDPELVRVKGKGGKTPLHVAAEIAPPQLFAELLYACPSSIEDLTARRKTALHIVVEATRFESLEILLGWLLRRYHEEFLYCKDIDGNTVLHVATRTNQIQVVKSLLNYMRDDVKNCKGDTALAIHERNNGPGRSEEIGCVLQDAKKGYMALLLKRYRLMVRIYLVRDLAEIEGTNRRSIIPLSQWANFRSQEIFLAVAMLVATTTYQGVLSPPGGFWQGDSSIANTMPDITTNYTAAAQFAGKMVMSGDFLSDYISANSGAFSLSLGLIVASLPSSIETFYILLCMAYFVTSYRCAIHSILPPGENDLQVQVDSNIVIGMEGALYLLLLRLCVRWNLDIKLNTAGRGWLVGFAKLRVLMRMLLDRARGTRDGSLDDHTVDAEGNRVRDHP